MLTSNVKYVINAFHFPVFQNIISLNARQFSICTLEIKYRKNNISIKQVIIEANKVSIQLVLYLVPT